MKIPKVYYARRQEYVIRVIAVSVSPRYGACMSQTLAGVVAVDGGTIGLDVSFGAFLAVILGLFIPVVFLVTLCELATGP